MFMAVLFIIAETWKQPKCSLESEWINKVWYIHNGVLFSDKEKMSYQAMKRHGGNSMHITK